jgi:hypothetical protein
MDSIWQMVGMGAGMVALVLVFQLLDLPEWISTYFKNQTSRKELEEKIDKLEVRIAELEQKIKS